MNNQGSHRHEYVDGRIQYFNSNYVLHREDGPAIEHPNGSKEYFINGLRHREDGPAYEFYNGDKWWFKNGMLHREDGPACEYISGCKQYYLNDIEYNSLEEGLMDQALG